MSGGIDWFRWHHGSVTDPKFQLVARKACARLSDVLAIWAYVLEHASAADVRGEFGDLDHEAIDCLFGFDDGLTAAVLEQMAVRGLVCDGAVSSWTKRQPKREREDDKSTERSRAFRQKQRQETPEVDDATPCNATQRQETPEVDDATPCNATQRQETPRGEERREEKITTTSLRSVVGGARKRSPSEAVVSVDDLVGEGVDAQHAKDWFIVRKGKGAKSLTRTAWDAVKAEAEKAGMTPAQAVKTSAERTWQGFRASWLAEIVAAPDKPSGKSAKHAGFETKDYTAGVTEDGTIV